MASLLSARPAFAAKPIGKARAARSSVRVQAASWQKATSKSALKEAGGKQVVELDGERYAN